jgi:hypothetical protein
MLNLLRLSSFVVVALTVLPSRGSAQARAPTLHAAELACPECMCQRARTDVNMLREDVRALKRTTSARRPKLMMLGGFAGTGVVAVATFFTFLAANDTDSSDAVDARSSKSLMAAGGFLMSLPLAFGLTGTAWFLRKRMDTAPEVDRMRERQAMLKEAKRWQRDACLGAPSR